MSFTLIAQYYDKNTSEGYRVETPEDANKLAEALVEKDLADVVRIYDKTGEMVGHVARMVKVEEARGKGLIP